MKSLLNYVGRGNTAFIAADNFYGPFADTLKIATGENYETINTLDSNGLNFTDDGLWRNGTDYSYKKGTVDSYFEGIFGPLNKENIHYDVLGTNSNDSAVMISIKYGKGTFILFFSPNGIYQLLCP